MDREMIKLIIGTSSGVLIGGFVGFVVTQRVLKAKYEAILEAEIASLKSYYGREAKDDLIREAMEDSDSPDEFIDFEDLSEEDQEKLRDEWQRDLISKGRSSKIIQEMGYSDEPPAAEVRPEVAIQKMTVEEATPIDPDDELLKEMIENRRNDEPYVITIDEFMEDVDFIDDKVTVTYFDGDGNLCDSQDKIIPEVEETLGSDALTKFGLFSKDKNIVYVRNERMRMDFEVMLDERSFTEAIAGFRDPKIQRKMREDD